MRQPRSLRRTDAPLTARNRRVESVPACGLLRDLRDGYAPDAEGVGRAP
jgi:hypothetical protein